MVAPNAIAFRTLVKGNEDSENEITWFRLRAKLSNNSIPCMRISLKLDFFCHYPFSVLFVAPFFSFFLGPLTLATCTFTLHVCSGSREKLDVFCWRSLEMDLDQSYA